MMSEDLTKHISSLASAGGHTRSNSQDGAIGPSGPAPVPVSRFRSLDNERAMPTNDTSGPLFTASSLSAVLQLSLESRLQARTARNGSPALGLIWKQVDMPAGVLICRVVPSVSRIKERGFSGWLPTPTATDHKGGHSKPNTAQRAFGMKNLRDWLMMKYDFLYPPVAILAALMGYPTEWASVGASVTQSFPKSRRSS